MSVSSGIHRGPVAGGRLLLVLCGLLVAMAWSPAASVATGWYSTGATLPSNAAANPGVSLGSVSCGSAGDCGAAGSYVDSSSNTQGLLATETAGVWQPAVEAGTPMPAATHPYVTVSSVSCPAAGSCSAVGEYADSSNYMQGLLLTESSGTWQSSGVMAPLPANAAADASVLLSSVSCAATGDCAAVGTYLATTGGSTGTQGLLLTESSGVWATRQAVLPAGAQPGGYPSINSVSCPSAGNCSAVGSYRDSSGYLQGMVLTETAGTWQPAIEATLPANAASSPFVSLRSVSCAAAGECSAVGVYADSSNNTQGLLLTETPGGWQQGTEASLPANALGSGQIVALGSVSCGSVGECSAVGTYSDSSSNVQGLLVTETAGTWQQPAVEASLPANAQSYQRVRLGSVSCASSGDCTAVGSYADMSSNTQELWLTETSGTWGTGVEASAPVNAGSDPNANLASVACASAQDCSAVGLFRNSSGNALGLLAAPMASPAVSLSVPSSGVAGGQLTAASISASLSAGSAPAGTVTFSVYGPQSTPPSSCGSGGTIVGTAAVSGDGTYHPSSGFTPASAGDYWWYASYTGDARNSAAASGCGAAMPETVVTAPPGPGGPPSPTATSVALRSSSNPSVSGQHVTYTATVSPTPDTGTVRFIAGGQPIAGCAAVPVAAGHGTATCATTYRRPGTYPVQAVYGGDAHFTTSQSTSLRQTVRSSIALVRRPSGRSGQVSFTVSCARASGGCAINLLLTTVQTLRRRQHGHTKVIKRVTTVGTKTVRIAAGKTITVTVKLNSAGRKLIAGPKRLPVTFTLSLVTGAVHIPVATGALTVTLPKPRHRS